MGEAGEEDREWVPAREAVDLVLPHYGNRRLAEQAIIVEASGDRIASRCERLEVEDDDGRHPVVDAHGPVEAPFWRIFNAGSSEQEREDWTAGTFIVLRPVDIGHQRIRAFGVEFCEGDLRAVFRLAPRSFAVFPVGALQSTAPAQDPGFTPEEYAALTKRVNSRRRTGAVSEDLAAAATTAMSFPPTPLSELARMFEQQAVDPRHLAKLERRLADLEAARGEAVAQTRFDAAIAGGNVAVPNPPLGQLLNYLQQPAQDPGFTEEQLAELTRRLSGPRGDGLYEPTPARRRPGAGTPTKTARARKGVSKAPVSHPEFMAWYGNKLLDAVRART